MTTNAVEQARKYLAPIPGAVAGQGGSTATLKVAKALVQDFDLDDEPALELLREFNGRCDPPWTQRELEHKIQDARRTTDPARLGEKLNGRQRRDDDRRDPVERWAGHRGFSPAAVRAMGGRAEGADAVAWPMFLGTDQVGLSLRRADGKPFTKHGGKSHTAKGGRLGLFLSDKAREGIPDDAEVLMAEGIPNAAALLDADAKFVIGLPQAPGPNAVFEDVQQRLAGHGGLVVFFADDGAAGVELGRRLGGALANVGIGLRIVPGLPTEDLDERLGRATDRRAELARLMAGAIAWRAMTAAEAIADEAGGEGGQAEPEGEAEELPIWGDNGRLIPLHVAKNVLAGRDIIFVAGSFHEYEGGVYRRRPDFTYERLVIEAVGPSVKRGALLDVLKLMQVLSAISPDDVYQSGRVINLANGLLDLDKGLLPHTPEHVSTTQIPIRFDPEAMCPDWAAALEDWFPGEPDMAALLQEWFGYCLIPDSRQHKAMVMLGEGANGKSVLCEVLKALVGIENVSAVSLSALGRSFALAELYGKLVNLTIEADIREGIEEGTFKQVVAGDPIQAERKFHDPFVFRPFARFTIATNNLFHVDDRSEGFYRRLLIVRFNRSFKEAEQDRNLAGRLIEELPGILNWALIGLARLEERGRFLIPRRVLEEVAEYKRQNNPVLTWSEDCAVLGDPYGWESAADLYKSYSDWARESGHKPLARNKFGIELKRLAGVEARPHPTQARTRGYGGIRLCY